MRLRRRSNGGLDPGILMPGQPMPTHPISVSKPAIRQHPKKQLPWYINIPAVVLVSLVLIYFAVGAYGVLAVKYDWGREFPSALNGESMEPTIYQPIRLSWIKEGLSTGALLWISRDEKKEPGRIVMFYIPDGTTSVKRITKKRYVNGLPQFWMSADNSGVTGEGSGFGSYDWIDENLILGVVNQILTPERFLKGFSDRGRFRSWVELNIFQTSPSKNLMWHWNEGMVAFVCDDHLSIYKAKAATSDGELLFQDKFSPKYYRTCSWSGDNFLYPIDAGPFSYRRWAENVAIKEIIIKPSPVEYLGSTISPGQLPNAIPKPGYLDIKRWLLLHKGKITAIQPQGIDPSKLFDGDKISSWGPIPEDPAGKTCEVTIDLGQSCSKINGIELTGLNAGDSFLVEVLSSADGEEWKSVLAQKSTSATVGPSLWMTAPTKPARYFKLKVTALRWTAIGSINEFQLIINKNNV